MIMDDYRQAFALIEMEVSKNLWDKDFDNIMYIPQERAHALKSWDDLTEYFENVESVFNKANITAINDLVINVLVGMAYAYLTYHFEAEMQKRDRPFIVDGQAIFILRRNSDTWKIINYHESPTNIIKAAKLKL